MAPTTEVTLMALRDNGHVWYKVTRRLPAFEVAETRLFLYREDAEKLFKEWLENA